MRRFFVDPRSVTLDTAFLSPTESLHIAAVLRMQPGEKVELFDGTGTIYEGILEAISRELVTVRLLSHQCDSKLPTPSLFLLQSLLKPKKMDLLVQKATELGVHTLQPLLTRYTENRGNLQRQHERWQRIMLEACKQCKRPVPMQVAIPSGFSEISFTPFDARLILWEGENEQTLDARQLSDVSAVCLLIGPEGGFHEDEVAYAQTNGFQCVTLGRRILRAETAALAAVAVVQYLLGALDR